MQHLSPLTGPESSGQLLEDGLEAGRLGITICPGSDCSSESSTSSTCPAL